ncbi:hypothetical protein F4820DRAFT_41892 [Hypoxylon rubiginosum]|uniref:Uncharacterized protein n=1 Tax=Hypoxylon rubiginosum TaxID=110542 RepID=A0ACB9YRC6_9PEZI|nr:hypothetical protein F4820DRAFT_41892 [Hypoxylon rubiginosum]
MKATSTILSILTTAAIGAAVPFGVAENGLEDRQNSGCYPFEDPDCCVNYAVCQCANGWFYQYNQAENGCNPPWGILGTSVHAIPGFCC